MESTLFIFGDCQLDAAQRELRRSGERTKLQPRVFDLLLHLVENRDRAIGKDELQDAVWPGMVITDTALTRAVMKARKAVGDDAATQAVIRTVHGHGYQFVAPLTVAGNEGIVPKQATSPPVSGRTLKLPVILLAAVVMCLAVFGLWQAIKPETPPAELRVAVLPLADHTDDPELAWTRLGLMSFASKQLSVNGAIPVVADGSVAGISSAMSWDGATEDLSGSDLEQGLQKAFGATHLLAMELLAQGSSLRMNYTLIDSGGKAWRGTMVGSDAVQLADGVVQAVYGHLLGRSRMDETDTLVSSDPFNNEAFARGMDLVLEGRCADAAPFFRLITEQEPELFAPRLELAACLRILGEPDQAEAILTQLIVELEAIENPQMLGRTQLVLAILQNRTGRLDEAEATYLAARQSARAAGDNDLIARADHNLAILEKNRGNLDASANYLDQAAAGYRKAGREIMPGQLWSGYANLKMEQGKLSEASEFLDRALEAFRATGDRRNEAMMLNNYGYLRRMQGRLDEAETYHLQSLDIRSEIRDRVGVGRNYSMLSGLYGARGDYEKARDAAEQALAVARETKDRLFEGTSLAQLANAERRLGLTEQARSHYGESRVVLLSIQDTKRVIQVELKLAEMELAEGFPDAAESVALESLERARESKSIRPEIEAMVLLAEIDLFRGDENAALSAYYEALEKARNTNLAVLERHILVKTAELKMDIGQVDECDSLIGALSLMEPSVASLKTSARYAFMSGEHELAVTNLESARELAGDNWDDSDRALMQSYLEKQ